jgi:hypothetical protein
MSEYREAAEEAVEKAGRFTTPEVSIKYSGIAQAQALLALVAEVEALRKTLEESKKKGPAYLR